MKKLLTRLALLMILCAALALSVLLGFGYGLIRYKKLR